MATWGAVWVEYVVPILGGVGAGTLILGAAHGVREAAERVARTRRAAAAFPEAQARVADLEAQLAHASADSADLRKLLGLPPPSSSSKVIAGVTGQELRAFHDVSGDALKLVAPSVDPGTGKAGD